MCLGYCLRVIVVRKNKHGGLTSYDVSIGFQLQKGEILMFFMVSNPLRRYISVLIFPQNMQKQLFFVELLNFNRPLKNLGASQHHTMGMKNSLETQGYTQNKKSYSYDIPIKSYGPKRNFFQSRPKKKALWGSTVHPLSR